MADFLHFDSRSRKLQQEQQKRREAARLRLRREKETKEAAAKDKARIQELNRQRRLEQQRKEDEARRKEEAEQRRTGGVRYKEALRPVFAEGEGDKVLLPASALDTLTQQDAVSMGPMLFEISCSSSEHASNARTDDVRTTHAGVLSFIAEEGTIGLPTKVVCSLGGRIAQREGDAGFSLVGVGENVTVRYVRLAKAKFARVVPETIGLSQVSELRAMLENNLRNHATLTVGDKLRVWQRGKEYGMKVIEVRPEPQATLLDTDVEIDLELPQQAREHMEKKDAQDRAKTLRAHMDTGSPRIGDPIFSGEKSLSPKPLQSTPSRTGVRPLPSAMDQDNSDEDSDDDDEESGSKNAFDPAKHRMAKLQGLPEEPSAGEDGVFTCQLRTPQAKVLRRFRFGDKLRLLFDLAEAHGGIPGQYRIVMAFPRRVLEVSDDAEEITMREAGLASKQEAVILEHR